MNRFEVDGRPTMGGPLAGSGGGGGFTPNQALASQATWWVDPIKGSNFNNGKTAGTALKTRGEFYRRMAGVTLTQSVTVNITSSLNAGDVTVSTIYVPFPLFLNFVGTPVVLKTGIVAAYVADNGATNTISQMTVVVSGGWAALVGKVVEVNTGSGHFIRAVVDADLGGNAVHLSPQIDELNAHTNLVNGQSFTVLDYVSLGTSATNETDGRVTYSYLSAGTFIENGHNSFYTNCFGNFLCLAGNQTLNNSASNSVASLASASAIQIAGGLHALFAAAGGSIRITASLTCKGVRCENGSVVAETSSGVTPNLEFLATTVPPFTILTGGIVIIDQGFVYGSSVSTSLIQFNDRSCNASFANVPTVTNATLITYSLSGTTDLVTTLATQECNDTFGNRAIATYGQSFDTDEKWRFSQGVIAETIGRNTLTSGVAGVSGTLYFMQVFLKKGSILANCHVVNTILGIALTLAKVGLFDTTGALLAATADQSATWATTGIHSQAFIAPYTVVTSGIYFLGYLVVGGTAPGLGLNASPLAARAFMAAPLAGKPIQFGSQTGLADLPNPATIAVGTAPGVYWIAVS